MNRLMKTLSTSLFIAASFSPFTYSASASDSFKTNPETKEFPMIKKFTVSKDPVLYQAWPDVTLTKSGKMICVFSECTHHLNRDYTRVDICESSDKGRTWSEKRGITEGTKDKPYFYNCARISTLKDGRICIIVDRCKAKDINSEENYSHLAEVVLYFSDDEGKTWSKPVQTPLNGIVPDKLTELDNGRWIISAHYPQDGFLTQFMHYSDDQGKTWSKRITVAKKQGLNLCEVSMLPMGNNTIVAFLRENSMTGKDCQKVISKDNGETWGPVTDFPLPACHRPTAGFLQDGRIMITHRFLQGGKPDMHTFMQNLFAGFTDRESVLSEKREEAWTIILPIDFDRSKKSDTGYSGWVQFENGEIYIVNYIVDDAINKGQIRGYAFNPEDFILLESRFLTEFQVSDPLYKAETESNMDYPSDLSKINFTKSVNNSESIYHPNRKELATPEEKIFYYRSILNFSQDTELELGLGYDGPIKVFVDKKEIFKDMAGSNPMGRDKAVLKHKFSEGSHEIMISEASNKGKAWGIKFKISLINGNGKLPKAISDK